MSKIELFASFTYDHYVSIAGIDLATARREDIIKAFGQPDRIDEKQLFAKPNIIVDRLVYELGVGESATFNVNLENGYIESVILQAQEVDEVEDTAEIRKGFSRFGNEESSENPDAS